MMTDAQRYLFDMMGYLHLEQALKRTELKAAQQAINRYVNASEDELPEGFGRSNSLFDKNRTQFKYAFAFDKVLEALVFHRSFWPIVLEASGRRPRLNSGEVRINTAKDPVHRLHCSRESFGQYSCRYSCDDGKIYCDDLVVFIYLTDVLPGDGGLLLVPGSHKSDFKRPPDVFNDGWIEKDVPLGVANITARAGDIVITTELMTHGAMAWQPKDRDRRFFILRYRPQYHRQIREYPDSILARLSPETRELLETQSYTHEKEIVKKDFVTLTI